MKNISLKTNVINCMLNQFRALLIYYRSLAMWSFFVTIILTVVEPEIITALITKLFLMFIFWWMINDIAIRKKIRFYKMAGVSNLKLVILLYLLDAFFTCSFLLLIKGFT